jgi:4a-hydroxytetrahydrobiopterin dehydratase
MPQPLDDAAIAHGLTKLPEWTRDGNALTRTFVFKDFDGSIAFVNRVAAAANAAEHHPDIAISWNEVTIRTWSHDANGITQRDLDLAATLDTLPG